MSPFDPAQTEARLIHSRYRLQSALGRGGMGVVWLARDELLQRPVAVKEIRFPAEVSDDERAVLRERTLREARTAARLDHPAAIRVFDVVEQDGRPWIVMELVDGRPLSEIVADEGPLPPAAVARIGLQLVDALASAHRAGIIHRDVKPGNVILRDDGRVTLTDFGIATTAGDPSITSTGLLLGSPAYISPERARGSSPEPASDLWSLGATLFCAVEGHPPFDKGSPLATVTAVVTEPPAPYANAGPLAPVLHGLLAKDPAERLPLHVVRRSLREIAEDRTPAPAPVVPPPDAAHDGAQTMALRPASAQRAGRRGPSPRRALPVAAAAAVVFAAAAAAGALLLPRDTGRSPSAAPLAAYADPAGWSARVPRGWQRSEKTIHGERVTDLSSPDGTSHLRVEALGTNHGDPVADWQRFEPTFRNRVQGYQRVHIEPVHWHGWDTGEWEFSYLVKGARMRAVDREAVTSSGAYAVLFESPTSDWAATAKVRSAMFSSFRP